MEIAYTYRITHKSLIGLDERNCFEKFKESLDNITDEQFEALLNELEEEGEKSGCGMTVVEFLEKFITNYDDLEDCNDDEEE